MSELAVIIIPAVILVAIISCVVCTSRVLNSAAHSKRLSEIAAERFARALKEEAQSQLYQPPKDTGAPIIPHLALQPDQSLLLAIPEQSSPAAPSTPKRSGARAALVSHVRQQRRSAHSQGPLEENTAGRVVTVGADAPEDEAQNLESVGAGLLSSSPVSGLEQQQSAAEAATSFKTAEESLSQASFTGAKQVFAAGGEAVPQPQSGSTPFATPGIPQSVQASYPFDASSAEGIASPVFSTANSDLSGSSEMFSGSSRIGRRRLQSSQGASSPQSSPSAHSSSAQGVGQRSAETSRMHSVPSADSSPLQHACGLVQSNSTPPAPHAHLMDSTSSQGSLAQPGTASSSFARTASGRSSSRRSLTGLHGQQFSLESVQSNAGAWAASQRPAAATSEMGSITQGIGSREASPPVTGLPPAVAAAQARAAQASALNGGMSEISDVVDGPTSFRRFSTGSIVGQPVSSNQAQQEGQCEIVPADDQQQRRATMSSGTSLADQIEHALHVASGSKSPSSDASGSAARPPLAPRKQRASSSASKDSARRARLLEAMALIGRPLVPGLDDAQDVAAASSTGLAPVTGTPDAQTSVAATRSDHHDHMHPHGASDLGVINESPHVRSSSCASRAAQSEDTRSSQDSQQLSSLSSSHQMRRRPLSGEQSAAMSGDILATQESCSSPLRPSHDVHGLGHIAVHAQTQTVLSDTFTALGAPQSEAESGSGFSVGAYREQPALPLSPLATSDVSHGSKVAAATASAVAAAAAAHEAVMALQSQSMPLVKTPTHDWHSHSTLLPQPQQGSHSMPLAQPQRRSWQEWETSTSIPLAYDQLAQHDRMVHHAGSPQEAPHREIEPSRYLAPLISSETSDSEASPLVPILADRIGIGAVISSFPPGAEDQPEQVPAKQFSNGSRRQHPVYTGPHAELLLGTMQSASEAPPARIPSATDLPSSAQDVQASHAAEPTSTAPAPTPVQPLSAIEQPPYGESPDIAAEWHPGGDPPRAAVLPSAASSAASCKPQQQTQVQPEAAGAHAPVLVTPEVALVPEETEYMAEPPCTNDGIPAITPMRERVRVSNTPSFASTSSSHPPAPASLASVTASLVSPSAGNTHSSYYNHASGSIGKGDEKALETQPTGSVRSTPARAVTASPASDKKQFNRPITARAFYTAGRPSRTVRVHLRNTSRPLQTPSTASQRTRTQYRPLSASSSQASVSARDSDNSKAIGRAEDARCLSASSVTGTLRGEMSVLSSSSADLDSQDDGLDHFTHQDTASIRTPRLAVASWRSAASDGGPSEMKSARLGGRRLHNDVSYVESDDIPELEMAPGNSEVLGVRRHVFAGVSCSAVNGNEMEVPVPSQHEEEGDHQQDIRESGGVTSAQPTHRIEEELERQCSSCALNSPQVSDAGPNALETVPFQDGPSMHQDALLSSQHSLESYPFIMPQTAGASWTATEPTAGARSVEDSAAILEGVPQQPEDIISGVSDTIQVAAQHTVARAAHATYVPTDVVLSTEAAAAQVYMADMSGDLTSACQVVPAGEGPQEDLCTTEIDTQLSTSPPGAESVFTPPVQAAEIAGASMDGAKSGSTEQAVPSGSKREGFGLLVQHGCAELDSLPDEELAVPLPVSTTASVLAEGSSHQTVDVPGSTCNATHKDEVASREAAESAFSGDQGSEQHGVRAVAVGSKGTEADDMRTVSAILPSLPHTDTLSCVHGANQGDGVSTAVVAELDDALSALGAATQQVQLARKTSVQPALDATVEQDAKYLRNELLSAAARMESGPAEAVREKEGDQDEACSEASTTEAPWSTGSSCGGEVVQVVHEGWGSAELPVYQLSGERMADLAGMAGYDQMSMESQLNMRRREFAPLDSWVPVAMETIVEEDSCDAEGDSARVSNRTPRSGASVPNDVLPQSYDAGPSNLHLAHSGNKPQEVGPQQGDDDDEPRWVLEERRGSQTLNSAPSFETPHVSQMVPSTPGPCASSAAGATSVAPEASSQAVGITQANRNTAYPEPQVPVTSPSVPQMPVAASPGTESTLSHPSGRVEGTALERSRTGAALAVPSLVMDHMHEGASSVGGSTSGSISGSNPGSARRIVPAAVTSWLDSPERLGLNNRRESDSGTSLGWRLHAASESSSRPRAVSDTGSTAHSGMFRPRGAGSVSTRTSATLSRCDMDGEQDVAGTLDACVQHEADAGETYAMQQHQSTATPPYSTGTCQPGPVGEGTEDSDSSIDFPVIDLKPHPASDASTQHETPSPRRLQGQAGPSTQGRLFGEGNATTHKFMPSIGEPDSAPARAKQTTAASRQPTPVLASLPEDLVEPNANVSELKRLVQAAAARARESTHLVPPLQQQLPQPSWAQASTYMPESPSESLAGDGSETNTDACPHSESIASDKPTSTQEITLALPSSAATGSAALSPCNSAAISAGGITITPSAGIADKPSFTGDAAKHYDSCESIPLQPGFNPDAYSTQRRRPASIAWSACSDLMDDCRSLSRADSSVRSASRNYGASLRSGPVTHTSAAPAQDSQYLQQRARVLAQELSQLTMSTLMVVYTCDHSIHGPPSTMTNISEGATEPGPLSTASRKRVQSTTEEWGPNDALSPAKRSVKVPQSLISDDSEAGRGPLDVQTAVQRAPVMLPGGSLAHSQCTSSTIAHRAAADMHRYSSTILRSTSDRKVRKKRLAVASSATMCSIEGHRSSGIERWMAAAQEAVYLMTLTKEARWARMNDSFDNLPEGVEWVVVAVEPGQSLWQDAQMPVYPAAQLDRQGMRDSRRHALQSDVRRLVPDSATSSNEEEALPSGSARHSRAGARRGARLWKGNTEVDSGVVVEMEGNSGLQENLQNVVSP